MLTFRKMFSLENCETFSINIKSMIKQEKTREREIKRSSKLYMIETNYEWMQQSSQPYSRLWFSCLLYKMIMDGRLFD